MAPTDAFANHLQAQRKRSVKLGRTFHSGSILFVLGENCNSNERLNIEYVTC
jgi:hypothetical protein